MKKALMILLPIAIILAGGAYFFTQNTPSQPSVDTEQKKPKAQSIKVGAILPFSGGLEIFGEQAKVGIDLAVQEINQAGGIQGHMIDVIFEDNKTDNKTSVEKANKLIRKEGAIALIGPITSSSRDAIIPSAKRFNTPLLYATNHEGGLCEPNVFSFNSVPNQELEKLIPEMAQRAGNTFYLYGTDYIWPQKMFEQAEKNIAQLGGTVAGKSLAPWGVKDFSADIRKIMDSNAQVLLFAMPGVDGTTFIKQAHELGLTQKMPIAFLGFSETYLSAFGENNSADIWVAVPFISTTEENKAFVQKLKQANPQLAGVSHYAKAHYNAIKALAESLKNAKNLDADAVLKGLTNLNTQNIEIVHNQVNMNMYIGHVQNGQLTQVKSLGKQVAQMNCQ